jgi:GMP reductase
MKIDYTPQLDFNNVLIRPKRTVLNSRSNVDMEREFRFPHSKQVWKGVPVIAANMDTTGTFGVYDVLSKHKMITSLHKFYGVDDFKSKELDPDYFMVSSGINFDKIEELKTIITITKAKWLCIDVANGYMKKMVDFCRLVRDMFPNLIIVA